MLDFCYNYLMQEISFNVDGQKLKGTIYYPQKPKAKNPAVLFIHGWTSDRTRSIQYARALSDLGFVCMTFDMRGHGESEGDIKSFTIKDFLDDVIGGYDYLSKIENVSKGNISAIGSSFGSYLIALLSEKRKVKNLSLRVPADYRNDDFYKSKYEASGSDNPIIVDWRNKVRSYTETFALSAIHNFDGNTQIIESENDTIVPHRTIQNYIDAIVDKSKLTYVVLKGAPHSIKPGRFRDEVTKILTEWFKNRI